VQSLKQAIRHLCILGALDFNPGDLSFSSTPSADDYLTNDTFHLWTRDPTQLNPLGVVLSKIPVSPKYAKMLLAARKYPEQLLTYCIMIVACMSVPELFTNQQQALQSAA